MAKDSSAEIAVKLDSLRQSFRQKAVRDMNQLEEFLSRIADKEASKEERRAVVKTTYHLLHRLAGSAGTFGLGALGSEARQLEQSLKPLIEPGPGVAAGTGRTLALEEVLTPEFFSRARQLRTFLEQADNKSRESVDVAPAEPVLAPSEAAITVFLCDLPNPVSVFLEHSLTNHGFTVDRVDVSELLNLSGEVCAGSLAVITSEEAVASIASALQLLKRQYGINSPPLICTGNHNDFDSRYTLAEMGADALFSEPLDVPLLAERIERLIDERSKAVPGKVLILDDDEDLAKHYQLVLQGAGFDVHVISDPEKVIMALAECRPDIMLLDVRMGRYSGVTVAKLIRFEPEWLGLPIIYLSSEKDWTVQLDALAQGGDEFMTKPVSDDYLVRAVQVRCYRARQLNQLVIRDSLTGLLKHSVIKQEIEREHARCLRMGHVSTVAMIDLDHFKRVNDRYGHGTGDHVIKALANLLRHRLRSTDLIGRYGGEEFVVVLPNCTANTAIDVLGKIGDGFSEIQFATNEGDISVTLSGGVAELSAFKTASDALNAADEALYWRKKAGRDGITAWHPHP
ncbi:diguanylate cyclase [uncultured Marinobacter sp.]|uniref:diguanylate cyclase n=1 Tax=uncultured Marinobacter sp. TaxID=187379 RepID=UPI0026216D6F|nr:diguanylate cyclase [uncultured Marinobacter sp.]